MLEEVEKWMMEHLHEINLILLIKEKKSILTYTFITLNHLLPVHG